MEAQFAQSRHGYVSNNFGSAISTCLIVEGDYFARRTFGGPIRRWIIFGMLSVDTARILQFLSPPGVSHQENHWVRMEAIDSTQFGDVMGSLWNVGLIGKTYVNALNGP